MLTAVALYVMPSTKRSASTTCPVVQEKDHGLMIMMMIMIMMMVIIMLIVSE